jgi:hypothetical protein
MNSIARFSKAWLILPGLLILAALSPKILAAADASDKLVITKAVYGDLAGGKMADVTAKVAAMVKDNALSVDASNEVFDDPAQGTVKQMRVNYTVGGVAGAKLVNEHETLTIAAGEKPPVIVKAAYGDLDTAGGASSDVTAKVAAKVKDGELSILVSKETFGDSAAAHKKLRIDFTVGGKPYSKSVEDNVYLMVCPVVAQTGDLIIQRARWGDLTPNTASVDVTDLVAAKVKNGALSIEATDANFGNMGDPTDSSKKLEVKYTLKGVEAAKTISQDDTLTLPPAAKP